MLFSQHCGMLAYCSVVDSIELVVQSVIMICCLVLWYLCCYLFAFVLLVSSKEIFMVLKGLFCPGPGWSRKM